MKSFAALLFLGAIPGLAWVVPQNDMIAQGIFDRPHGHLEEVQEVFKSLQEKIESQLEELQEVVQGSVKKEGNYAETAMDNAFEEYMGSQPSVNDNIEFFDMDAWMGHFDNSGLNGRVTHKNGHSKDHSKHDWNGNKDSHHGRHNMPPRDHTGPHTNSTLWDLISSSNHTKRFYELLEEDQEAMGLLQDKESNVTVFVPSNHAFELLDRYRDHHNVSKELIHRVLMYHIVDGTHEAQDLQYHNTLVTKLYNKDLGKGMHQRIRIGFGQKGPSVNFYSHFTMVDVFGNNGVVHGLEALLLPPPDILELIKMLPAEFSTSEAALSRTGLVEEFPKLSGSGMTVFMPSNRDWKRLGIKLNAFLFSECGNAYLRALMKYHIAPGNILYSDALVSPGEKEEEIGVDNELDDPNGLSHGYSHVNLPTLLKDRNISVDITRMERFLSFRINGLNSIVVSDGIAKSGVIQVPDHVLIPPHSLREHYDPPKELGEDDEDGDVGIYSVEQFKLIFAPLMEQEEKELESGEL